MLEIPAQACWKNYAFAHKITYPVTQSCAGRQHRHRCSGYKHLQSVMAAQAGCWIFPNIAEYRASGFCYLVLLPSFYTVALYGGVELSWRSYKTHWQGGG